ncbi:MAG: hypothetical protein ACOX8R_09380 [Bacillota bacterium]|jgi:predicted small lipoprotein YifL
MMKKILLALLAAVMIFSFSACGGNKDASGDVASDSDLQTTEEPQYTSDGDLIVDSSTLPASDSDLTEE